MLQVVVSNKSEKTVREHRGPIVFGRDPESDLERFFLQDPYVSRTQLRVEELPPGRVRLDNLSRTNRVTLADGSGLETGESRDVSLPVRLTVGQTLIDIAAVIEAGAGPSPAESLRTISQPVSGAIPRRALSLASLDESPSPEVLAQWFETLMQVQRAAASSSDFYGETARALVELVGLDIGLVLLRKGGTWEVAAQHRATGVEPGRAEFSQKILGRVVDQRRTYFDLLLDDSPRASLMGARAVVASPIFDESGDGVAGVLYGTRHRPARRLDPQIRPLEAQIVQILASAASGGRARLASDAEAARRKVEFEQFFSSDLADELERDPGLLEGRDREVTILFSDIRDFSRLSENLPPRETCRLVGDVMERLTLRIREHQGVVVDYIGDGLLAMWNAPRETADHATLACKAAVAMQAELPGLNDDWQGSLAGPIALGIGLNTGMALVGNTGSRQKFKYGPLGHAVNLASRVEGATKQLGVPALITGSTRDKVGPEVSTRRIGKVRVKGIVGAVDLYELHLQEDAPDRRAFAEAYERALSLYEQGRFADACQAVYPLLSGQAGHYDRPSLTLASLSMEGLKSPPKDFDPVIELGHK